MAAVYKLVVHVDTNNITNHGTEIPHFMSTIQITETLHDAVDPTLLKRHFIEWPLSGTRVDVYALEMIGWVIGERSSIVKVRINSGSEVVGETGSFRDRPDVERAFPEFGKIENCGYRILVNMIGLPGDFELRITAEFTDGSSVSLGRIRGNRSALSSGSASQMQPLMITTLGRTGSTWLTHLLGSHPEIITYRPFKSEPRASTYWARILLTLASPASYMQMLAADLSEEFWWLGSRELPFDLSDADPELLHELGATSVRELASLCRSRIENFYRKVGEVQQKSGARFFAEKLSPDRSPLVVRDLYPAAKEIVLVRDFRDMLCSIIAYSAKLGFTGFGNAGFANRAHYVWKLRTDVVLLLNVWRSRRSQVHLVRYEDLIRQPHQTAEAIFRYLGVADTDAAVGEVLEIASREVEGSSGHRTTVDAEQSIGRWRQEIDVSLQAVCREALGDILTEFDYSLD